MQDRTAVKVIKGKAPEILNSQKMNGNINLKMLNFNVALSIVTRHKLVSPYPVDSAIHLNFLQPTPNR